MLSKNLCLSVLILGLLPSISPAQSEEIIAAPLNQLILDTLKTMPSGGGYSAGSKATKALQRACQNEGNNLFVEASRATPSYCSEATYLLFLKVLSNLQGTHRITLSPTILDALKPSGQPDGTGLWGRWNANGPGTARLFYELGLGPNFTNLAKARPGDFLKIFWTDSIGMSEHGHSVIYLGTESREGLPHLIFWSSNIPGGFGMKSVPLSRIHRLLFSRLEHPEFLERISSLPRTDPYLASLQTHSSTPAEMEYQCGIR